MDLLAGRVSTGGKDESIEVEPLRPNAGSSSPVSLFIELKAFLFRKLFDRAPFFKE